MYKSKYSELAQWLESELPEGFTVFHIVPSLNARRKHRTTNMVEFQNKDLKKKQEALKYSKTKNCCSESPPRF